MGSPCEVQLFAPDKAMAKRVASRAMAEVERLEALYSRYRPQSFLSHINAVAADGGSITVDLETAALLDYADTCYAQSDGLFDITSGVLRRAWGRFDADTLPGSALINALLEKVGWEKVIWKAPTLEFPVPGLEIDFGGIVKEFAADRLAALCIERGLRSGVVNLGGDVRVIGPREDGSSWHIGIRHPREREAKSRTLLLQTGALASSGDYERCIQIGDVRYGHILNPRTGWPVRRMAAVSVVADLCVVAGSASTIAMLKEDNGPAWLEALGLPYLWVDVSGKSGGPIDNDSN